MTLEHATHDAGCGGDGGTGLTGADARFVRCVENIAATVQPRLTERHHGCIAMPELNQARIAGLIEMLLELLDATDLSDAESDVVVGILLPKLWERSGLDLLAFHVAVGAALSNPGWVWLCRRGGIDPGKSGDRLRAPIPGPRSCRLT